MDIIYSKSSLQYPGNRFPEGPYRLEGIAEIGQEVSHPEPDESLVHLIHPGEFIQELKSAGEDRLRVAEVATNEDTFTYALDSVSLAWQSVQNEAFGCTRPPGHHATASVAKGFCFLNNMVIVTQKLVNEGKKVCILDFDGHQGDGTETLFYDSDQVLFFSIHQEYAYPYFYLGYHTSDGYDITVDRTGTGKGTGFTFNTPVPKDSSDDILLEWLRHYTPEIENFAPDIIGISAGFDGYKNDALLNLRYTQTGYYQIGQSFRELNIPVFGLLEGGYHNDVPACINAFVAGINGEKFPGKNPRPRKSTGDDTEWFRYYLERRG